MPKQEKFSIRKTNRGAVSTCIAVLSFLALANATPEVKASEIATDATTELVAAAEEAAVEDPAVEKVVEPVVDAPQSAAEVAEIPDDFFEEETATEEKETVSDASEATVEEATQVVNYYYEEVKKDDAVVVRYHAVDDEGNVIEETDKDGKTFKKTIADDESIAEGAKAGDDYDATEYRYDYLVDKDGLVYQRVDLNVDTNGNQINPHPYTDGDAEVGVVDLDIKTVINYYYEKIRTSVYVDYLAVDSDGNNLVVNWIEQTNVLRDREFVAKDVDQGTTYDTTYGYFKPQMIRFATGRTYKRVDLNGTNPHEYTDGDEEYGYTEARLLVDGEPVEKAFISDKPEIIDTKVVNYYYEEIYGDVVVNYFAVDANGDVIEFPEGAPLAESVEDTSLSPNGTAYDTTDHKPAAITGPDGKVYGLVEELTDGYEEAGVVEAGMTKEVNYYYREITTDVNVHYHAVDKDGNVLEDIVLKASEKVLEDAAQGEDYDTTGEDLKPKEIKTEDGATYRLVSEKGTNPHAETDGDEPAGKTEVTVDPETGEVDKTKDVHYYYERVTGDVVVRYHGVDRFGNITKHNIIESELVLSDVEEGTTYDTTSYRRMGETISIEDEYNEFMFVDPIYYEEISGDKLLLDDPATFELSDETGNVTSDKTKVINYYYTEVSRPRTGAPVYGSVLAHYVTRKGETLRDSIELVNDVYALVEDFYIGYFPLSSYEYVETKYYPQDTDYDITDQRLERVTGDDGQVYRLVEIEGQEAGVLTEKQTSVTYIYDVEVKETGSVIVHYVDKSGNVLLPEKVIANDVEVGSSYDTTEVRQLEIISTSQPYTLYPDIESFEYYLINVEMDDGTSIVNGVKQIEETIGNEDSDDFVKYTSEEQGTVVRGTTHITYVYDKLLQIGYVSKMENIGVIGKYLTETGEVLKDEEVLFGLHPTPIEITHRAEYPAVAVGNYPERVAYYLGTEPANASLQYDVTDKKIETIQVEDGRLFHLNRIEGNEIAQIVDKTAEITYIYTESLGTLEVRYHIVDEEGNIHRDVQPTLTLNDSIGATYSTLSDRPEEISVYGTSYRFAYAEGVEEGQITEGITTVDYYYQSIPQEEGEYYVIPGLAPEEDEKPEAEVLIEVLPAKTEYRLDADRYVDDIDVVQEAKDGYRAYVITEEGEVDVDRVEAIDGLIIEGTKERPVVIGNEIRLRETADGVEVLDITHYSDGTSAEEVVTTYLNTRTETEIPFVTDRVEDDQLEFGVEEVRQAGVNGRLVKGLTFTVVNEDLVVTPIDEITDPVTEIIAVGTKKETEPLPEDLQDYRANLLEERERLLKELVNIQNRLDEADILLQNQKQYNEDLSGGLTFLRQQQETIQKSIEQLDAEIIGLNQDLDKIEDGISSRQTELENLRRNNPQAQILDEIGRIEAEIKAKNDRINAIDVEISQKQAELASLQDENALDGRISQKESELTALKIERATIQGQIHTKTQERDHFRQTKEADITQMKAELSKLPAKITTVVTEDKVVQTNGDFRGFSDTVWAEQGKKHEQIRFTGDREVVIELTEAQSKEYAETGKFTYTVNPDRVEDYFLKYVEEIRKNNNINIPITRHDAASAFAKLRAEENAQRDRVTHDSQYTLPGYENVGALYVGSMRSDEELGYYIAWRFFSDYYNAKGASTPDGGYGHRNNLLVASGVQNGGIGDYMGKVDGDGMKTAQTAISDQHRDWWGEKWHYAQNGYGHSWGFSHPEVEFVRDSQNNQSLRINGVTSPTLFMDALSFKYIIKGHSEVIVNQDYVLLEQKIAQAERELTNGLKDYDNELATLRNRDAALADKQGVLEAELDNLKDTKANLVTKRQSIQNAINALNIERSGLVTEVNNLTNQLAAKRQELANTSTNQRQEELMNEIAQLTRQKEEVIAQITAKTAERVKLLDESNDLTLEIKSLEEELEIEQKRQEEFENNLKNIQRQKSEIEEKINIDQDKLDNLDNFDERNPMGDSLFPPVLEQQDEKGEFAIPEVAPVEDEKPEVKVITEILPFDTQYILDGTLTSGQEIVDQEGHEGSRTYAVTDEGEFDLDVKPAQTRIVRVGTKEIEIVPVVSEQKPTTPEKSEEKPLVKLLGAGGAAALGQERPRTGGASQARSRTSQAEKTLPETGDAISLYTWIGFGMSALGVLGAKRRKF